MAELLIEINKLTKSYKSKDTKNFDHEFNALKNINLKLFTGEIIGIYDMVPLSRKSVCSKKPVLYALEVNKGWFKKNGFHVGDFININAVIQNAK